MGDDPVGIRQDDRLRLGGSGDVVVVDSVADGDVTGTLLESDERVGFSAGEVREALMRHDMTLLGDLTTVAFGSEFRIPGHAATGHGGEWAVLLALDRLAFDDEYLTFAYRLVDESPDGRVRVGRIHDSSLHVGLWPWSQRTPEGE